MTTAASESWRRLPYLARLVRARPRMFTALVVGVITEALLPAHWEPATRLLVAWDVAVALYLALVYEHVARAKVDTIRQHAAIEDEGRYGILVLSVTAAVASLGAIVVKLGSSGAAERHPLEPALAILTILLSWGFIHTLLALHYAHQFYGDADEGAGGWIFPATIRPTTGTSSTSRSSSA
jgi:uncharacterized membrane protein